MLGKLLKDELRSYRFSMGVVFFTGVIFTIFLKVLCMIPYQSDEVKVFMQFLSIGGYILILGLMGVAVQVLIIIRFYSTMIGDRGYLTWTLPATPAQHITAKLVGGILWRLLFYVVILLLLLLFLVGNYWVWLEDVTMGLHDDSYSDILKLIIKGVVEGIGSQIDPSVLVKMGVSFFSAFVWSFAGILLIYMCMAIGQLFGKWRILASIGSYFGIMIVVQIISTVVVAVSSVLGTLETGVEVGYWTTMIIEIIIGIAACIGQFLIMNFIFKKHLNLE